MRSLPFAELCSGRAHAGGCIALRCIGSASAFCLRTSSRAPSRPTWPSACHNHGAAIRQGRQKSLHSKEVGRSWGGGRHENHWTAWRQLGFWLGLLWALQSTCRAAGYEAGLLLFILRRSARLRSLACEKSTWPLSHSLFKSAGVSAAPRECLKQSIIDVF